MFSSTVPENKTAPARRCQLTTVGVQIKLRMSCPSMQISLLELVKPGDQLDDRRFPRPCPTSATVSPGRMRESSDQNRLGIFITETDVVKSMAPFRRGRRMLPVCTVGIGIDQRKNALGSRQSVCTCVRRTDSSQGHETVETQREQCQAPTVTAPAAASVAKIDQDADIQPLTRLSAGKTSTNPRLTLTRYEVRCLIEDSVDALLLAEILGNRDS